MTQKTKTKKQKKTTIGNDANVEKNKAKKEEIIESTIGLKSLDGKKRE